MDSNFDKLFKEKFDQNEFTYQPDHWSKLERALPPERRHILPIWFSGKQLATAGIAAGIALIAGLFFYYHAQKVTPPVIHALVVPATIQPVASTPHVATPASATGTQPQSAAVIASGITTAHPTAGYAGKPVYKTNAPVTNSPIASPKEHENKTATTIYTAPATVMQEPQTQTQPSATQPVSGQSFANAPAGEKEKLTLASYDFNDEPKHQAAASMGVIGGLNYGTQNTGFSVGINGRYRLNDRLFIEGAVAYNNNQAQNTESMTRGRFQARTTGTWSGQIQSEPLPVALRTLSYLQVMPSVGYHLSDKLSMGLGADVQRLLYNDDYKTVTYTNNDTKLVPTTDFGLAAKAEYGISTRIRAGVLYREGLNTLFSYGYINRRYVQMQLSWSLFGGK